jgi:hypothetical protein
MIPYDLDPSLHSGQPERPWLDDGFSPPPPPQQAESDSAAQTPKAQVDPALWTKSEF